MYFQGKFTHWVVNGVKNYYAVAKVKVAAFGDCQGGKGNFKVFFKFIK